MAVQVRIEDLHHPEGGHARIVFTGVGRVVVEWFVIRRFDHQDNHLSPEGWRGPETHVAPLEVEDASGGVALIVGPDVTEWLEYGDRIEIALVDTTYSAVAIWPEIGSYVGQRRGRGRLMTGARAATARPQQQSARPPVQPTVAPGLQATVIGPRPVILPLLPPAPPVAAVPPPPAPPVQSAVPPAAAAAGRHRNSMLAALVLLLILGAGGGYYGYNEWQRSQDGPVTPPVPPTPPNPPTPPTPFDLASLVNRPPEEVFRMGETLFAQGSYSIAFSLLDDASRRGYGPAHTRIGQFYDPATFQADRPFQRPNPRRALEHFDAALAAGDQNARAPREALVARLREAARGTDPAAREAQAVLRDMRL